MFATGLVLRSNANWMAYIGCEALCYPASRSQPERLEVGSMIGQVSRKHIRVRENAATPRVIDCKAPAP
jgi:hypothetical protein